MLNSSTKLLIIEDQNENAKQLETDITNILKGVEEEKTNIFIQNFF